MVNLIEILEFVNSDKKGKTWAEIKERFKGEDQYIWDILFDDKTGIKPPYFVERHERHTTAPIVPNWKVSAEGIKYLAEEKRKTTQDKLTTSNVILTYVLVLATVIGVVFTIVSSAPVITGSEPFCPNQINGTISYIRQYGNYGKLTSPLSYELYGTNIVAYETVHGSSVARGFKEYVPGTFPLTPIDLNGNKQTDIEFVMKIENENITDAKFKVSFSYMIITFPVIVYYESGPHVCEYKKNETGVFTLSNQYDEIGLVGWIFYITIIIFSVLVGMTAYLIFRLLNRTERDWEPPHISQTIEKTHEPPNRNKK